MTGFQSVRLEASPPRQRGEPASAGGDWLADFARCNNVKLAPAAAYVVCSGCHAAMVSNSFIYPADALRWDPQDSDKEKKDTARRLAVTTRRNIRCIAILKPLRQRYADSEWGVNDLEAVVRGGVDVVRLPKTDTAQDVLDIEKEIPRIEKACGREPGSTGLLMAD